MEVTREVATNGADDVDEEVSAHAESDQDRHGRSEPTSEAGNVSLALPANTEASSSSRQPDEDVEEVMGLGLRGDRPSELGIQVGATR